MLTETQAIAVATRWGVFHDPLAQTVRAAVVERMIAT